MCPWPVEYFENRSCKHYQRDVEGETSGGACSVDGEDLIGIGCQRGEYETGKGLKLAREVRYWIKSRHTMPARKSRRGY